MGRTSGVFLADRVLDGKLTDLLSEWKSETPPRSFEACARELTALLGQSVTGETVRQWAIELGVWPEPEKAKESAA